MHLVPDDWLFLACPVTRSLLGIQLVEPALHLSNGVLELRDDLVALGHLVVHEPLLPVLLLSEHLDLSRRLVDDVGQLRLQGVDLGVPLPEPAPQCLYDLLLIGVQLHRPLVKAMEGVDVLRSVAGLALHI